MQEGLQYHRRKGQETMLWAIRNCITHARPCIQNSFSQTQEEDLKFKPRNHKLHPIPSMIVVTALATYYSLYKVRAHSSWTVVVTTGVLES